MKIIKQSVGIDIASETFVAVICKRSDDYHKEYEISDAAEFKNSKSGYNQLLRWVKKNTVKELEVHYAMEATGVYYEQLAYHLNKLKKNVSVMLPNKVTHYTKSLNIKSKTDEIDASVIAKMSAERDLKEWTPPTEIYRKLRSTCRLHAVLQKDKTQTTNRLHGLERSYDPLPEAIKLYKSTILRLEKEIIKLEKLMILILKSDEELWRKAKQLETIKGIGLKTIAIVLGETHGFALIENQRQLTSYCGYDIVKRESGTSIKSKTRISKKGNSNIRAAMYYPALSAIVNNPEMKKVYTRIVEEKKIKGIGWVAVQRRLLVLMYSLWKKDESYIEDYQEKKSGEYEDEDTSSFQPEGLRA